MMSGTDCNAQTVQQHPHIIMMDIAYQKRKYRPFTVSYTHLDVYKRQDVIHIVTEKQGIPVEVAMTYNTSFNESVFSYVNDINTIEAVSYTHLDVYKRQG